MSHFIRNRRVVRLVMLISTVLLAACSAWAQGRAVRPQVKIITNPKLVAYIALPGRALQIVRRRDTGKLAVIRAPIVNGRVAVVDPDKADAKDLKVYEPGHGRPIRRKQTKPATQPKDRPRTGFFRTRFDRRSKLSRMAQVLRRCGWKIKKEYKEYDLKDFRFEVYVPSGYTGRDDDRYGVMVYVSPASSVYFIGLRGYRTVYDRHRLIHVAAYNSGNDQDAWIRLGLAIDAVYNLRQLYNVDKRRIYASGSSGGGRCASILGLGFADVFDGAFPHVGCYFFANIKSLSNPKRGWSAKFSRPPSLIYRKARSRNRYVLLTGEFDFNREETKSIYVNGFKKFTFKHVTYVEVPKMGHSWPNAKTFAEGLIELDKPLKLPKRPAITPESIAARELAEAERLLKAGQADTAYAGLVDIASRFARTASGKKAGQKLRDVARDHPKAVASYQYDRAQPWIRYMMTRAQESLADGKTAEARDTLIGLVLRFPDHTESKEALKLLDPLWK